MNIKALFFILTLLAAPLFVSAVNFERDLYHGLSVDADVTRLQEFLSAENVYSGPVTGNFFELTREGVKKFQEREGISPSAGYFGPITRGRANAILARSGVAPGTTQEKQIVDLMALIRELQAKIDMLKGTTPPASPVLPGLEPVFCTQDAKMCPDGSYVSRTAPLCEFAMCSVPEPAPTPVSPAKSPVLEVTGLNTAPFPIEFVGSLKLGDAKIRNGTAEPILISQIVVHILDNMNTVLNRGRKVYFVLREGPDTGGNILSRTEFTFNSQVPLYAPHESELKLSYPALIGAGEEKNISIWIDGLEYVTTGELKISFVSFLATTTVDPEGGFTFILKRD